LALTQPVLVQFLESLLSVPLLQQNLWGPFDGALAIWTVLLTLSWLFSHVPAWKYASDLFNGVELFEQFLASLQKYALGVFTEAELFEEVFESLHLVQCLQSMDLASTVEQGCLKVTWKAELPHDVKENSLWSTSSFCFIRPSSAWEVQEMRKSKKS
jgi:hypothetical protein